jgi:hypothetical protein
MKRIYTFILVCILFASNVYADYSTPNTAVKWTLNDLVTNSGGSVTYNSGMYLLTGIVTISTTDTLSIITDEVVKFDSGAYFLLNGSLKIDPPTSVLFTASNQAKGFNGMKFNFSPASVIRKLTLEYAISCNISDCSPTFDSCIFQYNNNNSSTTFGNGSVALFRSKAIFTNTQFLNNKRAAIQGGANIANAPQIINCMFLGNNTTNQNVPQINLGASGSDTTKILNNQILAASTNSGGIGFLPLANLNVLITGNVIKKNRYGINLQGGSLINAVVSYNLIDSNNTQGSPSLGGSGIAFAGGSATSHQNSIVTGNIIRGNLWGITIQNFAKPNLGNLGNSDTTDDGKNWFYGNSNTNTTTPGIHLYNNSPDAITAQGNYWGSNDPVAIEASIFHQPDNNTLGLVDYTSYTLPVDLLSFTASVEHNSTQLKWKTVSEIDLDRYGVERSANGISFETIGFVTAAGKATYEFSDNNIATNKILYYRLKMIDKDGSYKYSPVISIKPLQPNEFSVKIFPGLSKASITAEVTSSRSQVVNFTFYDASGKLLEKHSETILAGKTLINLTCNSYSSEPIYIQVTSVSGSTTIPFLQWKR